MEINLFNARSPNGLRVPVTITMEQFISDKNKDGEVIYTLTLSCAALTPDKKRIDPVYINGVTNQNIQQEIQKGLAKLGELIDWYEDLPDDKAPMITEISPKNEETDVSFFANVQVLLNDRLPSSSIDPNTIKMYANDIQINSNELEISAKTPREYRVTWHPKRSV